MTTSTFTSILTLLETKLPLHCDIYRSEHKTSIHENGIRVSTAPHPGEIIRFFHTDDPSAKACFAMGKQGIRCCDRLLVFTREDRKNETELLCFIEIKKPDNIEHAVPQILDAHEHIMDFSKQHINSSQGTNVIKAVAIFLRNSPPRDISVREKIRLAKIFGTNVYTKHGARGNNSDFGQFVRKIYA